MSILFLSALRPLIIIGIQTINPTCIIKNVSAIKKAYSIPMILTVSRAQITSEASTTTIFKEF
jgi:hypothetical protein